MMKLKGSILITFVFVLGYFSTATFSQETSELKKEIVVTGSLIPVEFSNITRNLTIISRKDISKMPVDSFADLLKYIPGLDLKQRGPFGIQGDLSIRGSNFSQVLILVNGVKIYDPQTAHHNLDIPVSLSEIERIEILHGQGSSVYGENAFGGVINIITQTPGKKMVSGDLSYGEFKTLGTNFSLTQKTSFLNHTATLDYQNSDGFEFDREFNTLNFLSNAHADFNKGELDLLIGFNKKDFGANNFYAAYPSKEWTRTTFINLKTKIKNFIIKSHFRRHFDRFMLDINRPEWYVNKHRTYSYGSQVHTAFPIQKKSTLVLGGEWRRDVISGGLGNHNYSNLSFFTEFQTSIKNRIFFNAGIRSDYFTNYPLQMNPNLSLGYLISPRIKIRASLGSAFRIPSFTELFYSSPANLGNRDLKPEKNFSYEAGIDYYLNNSIRWETTIFFKQDRNLIAWIKDHPSNPWRAENIQNIDFFGIETRMGIGDSISLGYNYLGSESSLPAGHVAKYVFNHPIHFFSSAFHMNLPSDIFSGIFAVYKKRRHESGYTVVDIKISKIYKKWEYYLKATNLFNTRYQDIPGVSIPGRWIMVGFRFTIESIKRE